MKNFKKILFNFTGLTFSTIVLMQCMSSNNSTKDSKVSSRVVSIQESTSDGSSYVNLYDGRSVFPDSVHTSWQRGSFDETKTSVLYYIDNMISGIEKDIEKYEQDSNIDKVNIEKEKLARVKGLKDDIQSANDKSSLKNIMHDEFRSGEFKDLYGTGK